MELTEARAIAAEALVQQEVELGSAEEVGNAALYALQQESPARVVELVSALCGGESAERRMAARILAESGVAEAQKLELAVEVIGKEGDPEVIRSWVQVLQYSKLTEALPLLAELSRHGSSGVRHAIPDALSWCSDLEFERIAEPLLMLSNDEDAEVRWSALWELREWSKYSADTRIPARLATVADDPSEEVRQLLRFYDGDHSDQS